jgi:hypothetical protein
MRPRNNGVRFRLFPSYAEGFAEPEIVEVSLPAGSIGPGPRDRWMYAVNPLCKDSPYDPPHSAPPYDGPVHAPAMPDFAGNFDHIAVESEQFLAAHLYGTVRHTLDIWEQYLRRRVVWWHAQYIPYLELIPIVHWDNAQSGSGFIEMGQRPTRLGRLQPFCLNYDVMAHETGHAILFAEIGVPSREQVTASFLAFHESFADLVSLIGVLHFRSVTNRLLQQTGGNLYVLNLVNRIGEISDTEQIRLADNLATMDEVADITMTPDGQWIDPTGLDRNQHAIAEPLTGAVFDILVDFYQEGLLSRGLIGPSHDARGWTREAVAASVDAVQHESSRAFARFEAGFHAALEDARFLVGRCMAHVMLTIRPETLDFPRVAARFMEAAAALGQGRLLSELLDNFLWRGIDPRPFLAIDVPSDMHRRSDGKGRLWMTEAPNLVAGCACGSTHGFDRARRMMPHGHRRAAI